MRKLRSDPSGSSPGDSVHHAPRRTTCASGDSSSSASSPFPSPWRHAVRCETSRDLSLLVDGVQGRGVRVDVLDRSLDDDLRDFDERQGVRELGGRSLQQLGALAQPLFLVVELAALERERALGHHRLELTALRVAQVALLTERDVERHRGSRPAS